MCEVQMTSGPLSLTEFNTLFAEMDARWATMWYPNGRLLAKQCLNTNQSSDEDNHFPQAFVWCPENFLRGGTPLGGVVGDYFWGEKKSLGTHGSFVKKTWFHSRNDTPRGP